MPKVIHYKRRYLKAEGEMSLLPNITKIALLRAGFTNLRDIFIQSDAELFRIMGIGLIGIKKIRLLQKVMRL